MKTLLIADLACNLARIEAEKGKAKLAEKMSKELQAPFLERAGKENCLFVSGSGQELASVKFQTRSSLSIDKLIELGVTPEIIQAATIPSAPFAVFRIH